MCYAKPGPRCSSHLKETQRALVAKMEEVTRDADSLMQEQNSLLIVEGGKVVNYDDPEIQDLSRRLADKHEELDKLEEESRDTMFQWYGTSKGQKKGYEALSRIRPGPQQRSLSDKLRRSELHHQDRMSLYRASQVSFRTTNPSVVKVRNSIPEGQLLQRRLSEMDIHQRDRDKLVLAYHRAQEEGDEETLQKLDPQIVETHNTLMDAQEAAEEAYEKWADSPAVASEYAIRANEALRNSQPEMAHMYERAVIASTHTISDYRRGLVARPPSA